MTTQRTGKIYLRVDDGLVAMSESAYDAEDILQQLLADYPDLLAGDQMRPDAPRRWLLVSREVGIPDSEGGSSRWSLDHLFVDQDAVPTLVEVKRSSDTRLRREVVGQMLDYAANLVSYWPPGEVRALFEERCRRDGIDPRQELDRLLGVDDADLADEAPDRSDGFWQRVSDNLSSRRLRLVFVADVIPRELQSIVEFLNENLLRADVLAVEVKQYVGQGRQTLVPRVIGQTAAASEAKQPSVRRSRRTWTPAEALTEIEAADPGLGALARTVVGWADALPGAEYVDATRVAEVKPALRVGGRLVPLFALSVEGKIYLGFSTWANVPVLGDDAERRRVVGEINEALGTQVTRTSGWPAIPASRLQAAGATTAFLGIFARLAERVRRVSERGDTLDPSAGGPEE